MADQKSAQALPGNFARQTAGMGGGGENLKLMLQLHQNGIVNCLVENSSPGNEK